MQRALLDAVADALGRSLGRRVALQAARPVGGGCIHQAYCVSGSGEQWFVKINDASRADLFAAEADGLAALHTGPVRVPHVVCQGDAGAQCFLVLEWLDLGNGASSDYARLGEQLAQLHALSGPEYGWRRDNYIGATPQVNTTGKSWAHFYASARLAPQLALARRNGHTALLDKGERLLGELPRLLGGYTPRAALLHGDLWGGNAGFVAGSEPLLFDPAVYYGDPETDLAMTELFGGFPEDFYAAYRAHAALDPGYRMRRTLYQLYHVINHANLFGGAYVRQATTMMERLAAEA